MVFQNVYQPDRRVGFDHRDIRSFCDDTNSVQPFLPSVLGEKKKKKSLKVVPSLLMKGQLTDCPRKTGWVCTQEPNSLPNLIFQPQFLLPWTIYTTQGCFSMSPLHHSYCHCTCSGDSIVVALSSSSEYKLS